MANTGIMHLKCGDRTACNNRRAHMYTADLTHVSCKKCLASPAAKKKALAERLRAKMTRLDA
jgi:hypothetical protein